MKTPEPESDLDMPTPRVTEVTARATYDLRRSVLRSGTATDEVAFEGDDDPTTWHLAAVDADDRVIAVSTWLRRSHPDFPTTPMVQLRGMAVEAIRRSTGVGSLLLSHGIDRSRAEGAAMVWARARDTALGFYLLQGFDIISDGYVDATTGLPHHDVLIRW